MKIMILSPNHARAENFARVVELAGAAHSFYRHSGGIDELMTIVGTSHPDLVIADSLCHNEDDFAEIERVSLRFPAVSFLVLCENSTPEMLLMAMRIGVRDVLPTTATAAELLQVIERIGLRIAQKSAPATLGKVLAFMPCKGGSGSTFLATNLGYVLASTFQVSVSLIDLHPQFGDALLFVSDRPPSNTLPDVVRDISRLDASLLSASMVQILPNFSLLAGSDSPERSMEVKPDHVDSLLKLARSRFDFTILDLGLQLNANSIKALDQTDMIFLVLQETLPHIRGAKQMISALLSLGYSRDKINLLVNRYEGSASIRLSDIERALDMGVYKTCPNSFETVSNSVNQGIPLIKLNSHNSVSRFLLELGEELVPKKEGKENKGWFSRVLHLN